MDISFSVRLSLTNYLNYIIKRAFIERYLYVRRMALYYLVFSSIIGCEVGPALRRFLVNERVAIKNGLEMDASRFRFERRPHKSVRNWSSFLE